MQELTDKISCSLVEFIEKEVENRVQEQLNVRKDVVEKYTGILTDLRYKREEARELCERIREENILTVALIEAEANLKLMDEIFEWIVPAEDQNEPLD